MNIINVNSEIYPTPAMISFCEDVLTCDDEHYHHHCMDSDCLYHLSKEIPIFLVDETTFDKAEIDSTYDDETTFEQAELDSADDEDRDGRPSTEYLGYYTRSTNMFLSNTPVIVLCPERIKQLSQTDEEFTIFFAKVLVHELAHAKMDTNDRNASYGYRDEFWKWMEEPMANTITLEAFKNFDRGYRHHRRGNLAFHNTSLFNNTFDVVKNFIHRQPKNYAIAATVFDDNVYRRWWAWGRDKNLLGTNAKSDKVAAKKEWLNEIKNQVRQPELKRIFDELVK